MSDRRIITEHAHRQGVFVSVSVIADTTARDGDVTDAIRVASAKARDKFPPPAPTPAFAPRDRTEIAPREQHRRHVHFPVAGQLPLFYDGA